MTIGGVGSLGDCGGEGDDEESLSSSGDVGCVGKGVGMVTEVIEGGSSAGRVGSGWTLTCGDVVLSLDGVNLTCL